MSESQNQENIIQEDSQLDQANSKNKNKKLNKKVKKRKKAGNKQQNNQFISSSYRKQKCEFYNKGNCTKGDLCTYSHDFEPDTLKKICKYFLSGSCTKATQCQYSHNTKIYPCKYFHIQNRCQLNSSCRFSHNQISPDFYQEYMKDNKETILKLYKQNKLLNKELIKFIQDDIPKKQLQALPIIVNTSIPAIQQNKNLLAKDPRQRIKKNQKEDKDKNLPEFIKRQEQKSIKKVQLSFDEKFTNHLKQYFYSYY